LSIVKTSAIRGNLIALSASRARGACRVGHDRCADDAGKKNDGHHHAAWIAVQHVASICRVM
jgi:hypothetical protein